jgi:hypothetical protein
MRARLTVGVVAAATMISIPSVLALTSGGNTDSRCSLQLGRLDMDHCALVASDTAAAADTASVWGGVDCAQTSRQQRIAKGGDLHRLAGGAPPGDSAYRRVTVLDGDDFEGERCELGHNSSLASEPTFARFAEGQRRVTFASLRFPKRFPLRQSMWQAVLQMKQTQPSANGGGAPILEIEARQGRLMLFDSWNRLWSAPVRRGAWIRVAIDVRYSQDPERGTVKIYVDGDGDGDATGPREQSRVFHVKTLKRETDGGLPDDGIAPGQSIPSHLRAGIYHDSSYSCPPRRPCAIHLDNVQVVDVSAAGSAAQG